MYYYLVKETAKATGFNKQFKNHIDIFYYGKGKEILARREAETDQNGKIKNVWYKRLSDMSIKMYGFKRECDAKRSIKAKETLNYYWDSKYEVVKVKI